MGNGASVKKTEVEIIKNTNTSNENDRKKSSLSSSLKEESKINHRDSIQKNNAQLNQNLEAKYRKLLEENEKLKKDLDSAEKENIELIDELNTLEHQLELFTTQNTTNTVKDDFQKIIESKDKKIKELEDKLVLEEKNTNEVKSKYEEKLKRMRSKVDILKQDNALKIAEMRDKLNEMTRNNEALNENVKVFSETESKNDNTKLIIELSSHISEKEIMIMQLTSELEEKDARIQSLEDDLKKFKSAAKSYKTNNFNFESEDEILKTNKKKCVNNTNNRFNSAPSKSPVDMSLSQHNNTTRINVKEFVPHRDLEPYNTSNVNSQTPNKNNSLNASITSSLSNY